MSWICYDHSNYSSSMQRVGSATITSNCSDCKRSVYQISWALHTVPSPKRKERVRLEAARAYREQHYIRCVYDTYIYVCDFIIGNSIGRWERKNKHTPKEAPRTKAAEKRRQKKEDRHRHVAPSRPCWDSEWTWLLVGRFRITLAPSREVRYEFGSGL